MEEEAAASGNGTSQCKRSLSRKASSTSFRLRCPSLNSLRLRRVFDIFDKNGDAIITVQEINLALCRLGLETDISELDSTIKSFIKPGNIGLTFDDFVALHQSLDETLFGLESEESIEEEAVEGEAKMSQVESDLTEAFKVFDEDGDGFISAQELQVVLGKLGLPEGREIDRVQQMICSVDQNHDGRVDFFEFKHMMQSVVVRGS
ncbi:probable calcium-binding protein CML43 [Durio zibethinus]|uniref:Probable calcium-binding protein CML43 n=1 Tax=Durio zibethinus TaxID=66656 RepID=A0A6P6A9C4_DURZI|nr:probable calcium-binding protein CML43 [Durio zibethinus]XP_022761356.1 probable calcium-binding protein CML43 [Durio zibethinus]